MSTFDDPNREAVGLDPIWEGSDEPTPEEPPVEPEPEPTPQPEEPAPA